MKAIRPAALSLLLTSLTFSFASSASSQETSSHESENVPGSIAIPDVSAFPSSNGYRLTSGRYSRRRTPAMIGDFYAGSPLVLSGDSTIDRLFVYANDLDVPNLLPSGGSLLSLSEPGPVGIYSSSMTSTQDIQSLLRSSQPLPTSSLVGIINDNAVLSSIQTYHRSKTSLHQLAPPMTLF